MMSTKNTNDYDSWLEHYAYQEVHDDSNPSLSKDEVTNACALKRLSIRDDYNSLLDEGTIEACLRFIIAKHTEQEDDAYENFMDALHEDLTDQVWPQVKDELDNLVEEKTWEYKLKREEY